VYKGLGFFDADEIKDVLALLWYLADPVSDLRAAALLRSRFVHLSDEGLRRLAPRLADALRAASIPEAMSLDGEDAQALADAREMTARWRDIVDRLPTAELLDLILRESAYAVEMRGPRFRQARENLKKMRSLVRRMQNRGYATLAGIAAHLDQLAVGDESNASIEALDAVNLMTVHASKGLEFPVVFVVNLARGTGNRRDPIRVSITADASVSVSVGDFQSDADGDTAAREREETKRLLYVALTRARDRLYLGAVLKDGRIQPGRGSLAEVLPAALLAQFLSTATHEVEWVAGSGARHRFKVCAPVDAAMASRVTAAVPAGDFSPLADAGVIRQTAGAAAQAGSASVAALDDVPISERLVGTLVHRLLERLGVDASIDDEALARAVLQALRPAERADLDDIATFARRVATIFRAYAARADVNSFYLRGTRLHEMPSSLLHEGTFVRGSIDCVVLTSSGHGIEEAMVLEFKTGRPRREHELQLRLYERAAATLLPGARVTARLVYHNEATVAATKRLDPES
jgi:ATP-dependent helicase/nuclease subunit A